MKPSGAYPGGAALVSLPVQDPRLVARPSQLPTAALSTTVAAEPVTYGVTKQQLPTTIASATRAVMPTVRIVTSEARPTTSGAALTTTPLISRTSTTTTPWHSSHIQQPTTFSHTLPGGSRGISPATARLGRLALQAESDDESDLCRQLSSTTYPQVSTAASQPGALLLPGGGCFDELLVASGRSKELLAQMVELFKGDPPSDWGRLPNLVGQFHSQRGNYGQKVFSPKAVQDLLGTAEQWWGKEPNVSRLTVPGDGRMVLVGDTHGQLEDVLWIFFRHGMPSPTNQYLFLGDIVDRGGHALDILLLLFALKRDNPGCVHILRGNHEDASLGAIYGFKAELESKFGPGGAGGALFSYMVTQVLPLLPLAAVVADEAKSWATFVVHGGVPVVPVGSVTISQVESLNRFVPNMSISQTQGTAQDKLLFNLMWADPVDGSRPPGSLPSSSNGRGMPFMEQDTFAFCQVNSMAYVVRAHQAPKDLHGFCMHHQNRCITVFSASNYGSTGNKGGVLVLTNGGPPGFPSVQTAEHSSPPWATIAKAFSSYDVFATSAAERAAAAKQIERNPLGSFSVNVPAVVNAPGLLQWELHVVEQICRHKRRLYSAFTAADPQDIGVVSRNAWAQLMTSTLAMAEGLEDLAKKWEIGQEVEYVQFLHRFHVTSELSSRSSASTHVDLLAAMSRLRLQLSDDKSDSLIRGLDSDLDGKVSLDEFSSFLATNMLDIPAWQTAALYEALVVCLERSIAVEDVCMAIALISTLPETSGQSRSSDTWAQTAAELGVELQKLSSLFETFTRWDSNGDGFLSLEELQGALKRDLPEFSSKFSEDEFLCLMRHIDSLGVANNRISVLEFFRAVGPVKIKRALQLALLGEVLKPVYFYRAMLKSYLTSYDPSSNIVTTSQFASSLKEMNRQLESSGDMSLSESQINSVCEIASGGSATVQYRDFLNSLRAVDRQHTLAKLEVGKLSFLQAVLI